MPLTGTYSRNLDDKQRVAIPKRLCEEFGESELSYLYIAPGNDQSLNLYAPQVFEQLAQKMSQQASQRGDLRNYLRLFYARAERVDLDNQGRIRIPERLVTLARLQRDVLLLGVMDHVEVWDAANWQTLESSLSSHFDEMANRIFEGPSLSLPPSSSPPILHAGQSHTGQSHNGQ